MLYVMALNVIVFVLLIYVIVCYAIVVHGTAFMLLFVNVCV